MRCVEARLRQGVWPEGSGARGAGPARQGQGGVRGGPRARPAQRDAPRRARERHAPLVRAARRAAALRIRTAAIGAGAHRSGAAAQLCHCHVLHPVHAPSLWHARFLLRVSADDAPLRREVHACLLAQVWDLAHAAHALERDQGERERALPRSLARPPPLAPDPLRACANVGERGRRDGSRPRAAGQNAACARASADRRAHPVGGHRGGADAHRALRHDVGGDAVRWAGAHVLCERAQRRHAPLLPQLPLVAACIKPAHAAGGLGASHADGRLVPPQVGAQAARRCVREVQDDARRLYKPGKGALTQHFFARTRETFCALHAVLVCARLGNVPHPLDRRVV
mmetsp:Transcript_9538/g.30140  ORF Transcript_9538/g.30140 Transcript_9538/m.30140 type:complete len:341 (+) Transcript_9538:207-1229(+)